MLRYDINRKGRAALGCSLSNLAIKTRSISLFLYHEGLWSMDICHWTKPPSLSVYDLVLIEHSSTIGFRDLLYGTLLESIFFHQSRGSLPCNAVLKDD
jgi:hypothetical protein